MSRSRQPRIAPHVAAGYIQAQPSSKHYNNPVSLSRDAWRISLQNLCTASTIDAGRGSDAIEGLLLRTARSPACIAANAARGCSVASACVRLHSWRNYPGKSRADGCAMHAHLEQTLWTGMRVYERGAGEFSGGWTNEEERGWVILFIQSWSEFFEFCFKRQRLLQLHFYVAIYANSRYTV